MNGRIDTMIFQDANLWNALSSAWMVGLWVKLFGIQQELTSDRWRKRRWNGLNSHNSLETKPGWWFEPL